MRILWRRIRWRIRYLVRLAVERCFHEWRDDQDDSFAFRCQKCDLQWETWSGKTYRRPERT